VHRRAIDDLPEGAFVAMPDGTAAAVRGDKLLPWTPSGYDQPIARPRGVTVDVLTPPRILGALSHGYQPVWHLSAALVSSGGPATNPR
jgi:hypothetical protein